MCPTKKGAHSAPIFKPVSRYVLYAIFSNLIDYGLYGVALSQWGLIAVPYMILLTLVIDILSMYLYLVKKIDFIGINTIKKEVTLVIASDAITLRKKIKKFFYSFAMRGVSHWLAVIVLSIEFNPFMVVALTRSKTLEEQSLTRKDIWVFMVSFLIANTYWFIIMFGITNIIQKLLNILS